MVGIMMWKQNIYVNIFIYIHHQCQFLRFFAYLLQAWSTEYVNFPLFQVHLNDKLNGKQKQSFEDEPKIWCFKLPYLGELSLAFQSKLRNICQKYCKQIVTSYLTDM